MRCATPSRGHGRQWRLLLGTTANRVVFTSGGTEAANAAVFAAGQARAGAPMICADVEHSCVREAAARCASVLRLEVDSTGRIDLEHLQALLSANSANPPALVNCQWCNHEVGTLQPVAEVVACCRSAGVPVHVDAAAAAGSRPRGLRRPRRRFPVGQRSQIRRSDGHRGASCPARLAPRALRRRWCTRTGQTRRSRELGRDRRVWCSGSRVVTSPGGWRRRRPPLAASPKASSQQPTSARRCRGAGRRLDACASHRERGGGRGLGRSSPARPRPVRRRRTLRFRVLVGVHRAIPRPRRDGSRPGPFSSAVGRLVDDRGGRRGVCRLPSCPWWSGSALSASRERYRRARRQPACQPVSRCRMRLS